MYAIRSYYEPDIGAVAHAVENIAQHLEVVLGNLRFPQSEADGRNKVVELDRLDLLFGHLPRLDAIPLVLFENGGV